MKYISVPEAARLAGVSRITVYRWVKGKKVHAVRVGRNYLVQKNFFDPEGKPLAKKRKGQIEKAVDRAVKEYGDVLKRLSKE